MNSINKEIENLKIKDIHILQTVKETLTLVNAVNERLKVIEDKLKISSNIVGWKCVNCGKTIDPVENPNLVRCRCGSESWEVMLETTDVEPNTGEV